MLLSVMALPGRHCTTGKENLLSKEVSATMPKEKEKPLPEDKDALLAEIERLESEIKRLKLKQIFGEWQRKS